ncbi:MAG: type II toxin-antitoxin system HicB family antitoxin [Candidatus Sungbacteria bacterium]|nr:type II toxin-antitoxin system HicB family antitoxin [Candidatus Sungbacteria bacterium]
MKKTYFTSVIWKEGKYYVAQCLNIDVSSFGKTKREALKNLEEAVELYLEDKPIRVQRVVSPSIVVRELQYA